MQLPGNITSQATQHGAAASQQNAVLGNISGQFRRGAFQYIAGSGGNTGGQFLHGQVQVPRIDKAAGGQVGLPGMTTDLHYALKLAFGAAGNLLFQRFGG